MQISSFSPVVFLLNRVLWHINEQGKGQLTNEYRNEGH